MEKPNSINMVTIMSEEAMKERIKEIIDRLNNIRDSIKGLYIPTVDDEPLDGTDVHKLPELACRRLDETVKELSSDDCLSRLSYVSDNTISMVYSNIDDYIDETEDFVPENWKSELKDARILLAIIGEIWEDINDIDNYRFQLAHADLDWKNQS